MKVAKELLNCLLQGLLRGGQTGLLPFTCSISCSLYKQKVQIHGKRSHWMVSWGLLRTRLWHFPCFSHGTPSSQVSKGQEHACQNYLEIMSLLWSLHFRETFSEISQRIFLPVEQVICDIRGHVLLKPPPQHIPGAQVPECFPGPAEVLWPKVDSAHTYTWTWAWLVGSSFRDMWANPGFAAWVATHMCSRLFWCWMESE